MNVLRTAWWLGVAGLAMSMPAAFAQGSLTPPGPPGPTMRTLREIEPRTPIARLPYAITQPGSYYLTTNLVTGTPEGGITVAADFVTLDLRGFALLGAGPSTANVNAIDVPDARVGLVVQNGALANWSGGGLSAPSAKGGRLRSLIVTRVGRAGLSVGEAWVVSACAVRSNGYQGAFAGIEAGPGSTLRDCTAHTNREAGIKVGDGSAVIGCAAGGNETGILAGRGCRIADCAVAGNTGTGIRAGVGSTVDRCSATFNGQDGIGVTTGCLVTACTVMNNATNGIGVQSDSRVKGCAASFNGAVGIAMEAYSFVDSNNSCSNGAAGIRASLRFNRIEGNQASANGGAGIECVVSNNYNLVVGNNACANGSGNYAFPANTYNAQRQAVGTGFVLDEPWANFDY